MSSSSSHSPCAACKFLRRKCTLECVFAPYFPPDQPQKFACVHKVYGASNVAKILNELPVAHREEAVVSLAYEAQARLRDPVYGCVGFISVLHNRLKQVQTELNAAKKELAAYIGPQAMMIPSYSLSSMPPMFGIPPNVSIGQQHQQFMIQDPANHHLQHPMFVESAAQAQQQQMRFNNGFDQMGVASVGDIGVGIGGVFNNQMSSSGGGGGGSGSPSPAAAGVMSPTLSLQGSFNNNIFNSQMQPHQTTVLHHNTLDYQLQSQLLLQSQHNSEAEES
ncbi:LOB domain-containing protein 4-like [Humulus lupulus]|uniref:LOB domain-containing protein 4-like n=1 Tax=Humulus lupulus TaxID=3486 RepID=UPI002B40FBAE|nr:LOB domain-containing protein 4-like [Humulus lupulus]